MHLKKDHFLLSIFFNNEELQTTVSSNPDSLESLSALSKSNKDAYYVDKNGWIHTKFVFAADDDLRLGGILIDDTGTSRNISDDFGWDLPDNKWGLGSRWRFNMIKGYHAIDIRLDRDSYLGVQDCEDFHEPAGTILYNAA